MQNTPAAAGIRQSDDTVAVKFQFRLRQGPSPGKLMGKMRFCCAPDALRIGFIGGKQAQAPRVPPPMAIVIRDFVYPASAAGRTSLVENRAHRSTSGRCAAGSVRSRGSLLGGPSGACRFETILPRRKRTDESSITGSKSPPSGRCA
jgi:hypothetical protein